MAKRKYHESLIEVLESRPHPFVWFEEDGTWYFIERPNTTIVSREEILGIEIPAAEADSNEEADAPETSTGESSTDDKENEEKSSESEAPGAPEGDQSTESEQSSAEESNETPERSTEHDGTSNKYNLPQSKDIIASLNDVESVLAFVDAEDERSGLKTLVDTRIAELQS